MTTTEYESKRPPAHWLTDTLCGMLAFDGKPYTLSIEQQVAWDERFAKLVNRHGDEKTLDLLREFFETNRLKKSSRPGDFADFVARVTSDSIGSWKARSDDWDRAVSRVHQHAQNAAGGQQRIPEAVVLRLVSECHNDLQTAAIPANLSDELRERRKRDEWPEIRRVLVECWGGELVKRWREWRAATIEEVKSGGGYRLPRMGGL